MCRLEAFPRAGDEVYGFASNLEDLETGRMDMGGNEAWGAGFDRGDVCREGFCGLETRITTSSVERRGGGGSGWEGWEVEGEAEPFAGAAFAAAVPRVFGRVRASGRVYCWRSWVIEVEAELFAIAKAIAARSRFFLARIES